MKFANKNNIHISESGIQDVKNDQNWNENTHRVLSRSSRQSPRTGSALVSSKLRAKSKEMKRRKVAAFKKVSNCDDDGSSEDEDEDEINAYAFLGVNVNDNDHLESNQNTKSRRCKRKLSRIIAPMSNTLILQRELRKLEYLSSFFAVGSQRINICFRLATAFIWIVSLVIHFAFDANEAIRVYGHTFLAAQGVWMLNFMLCTLATYFRVLPWLKEGLRQLRRDQCHEKTITKVLEMIRMVPFITITFGLVASGFQHLFLQIDDALHVDYTFYVKDSTKIGLHFVRYITGAHVYAGYALFWLIPTTVMLMTGYAMVEFLDQFDAKMRDKERVMSFKEAISSYSARAKFVKESSSKCVIVLVAQLMSLVICFVLNTYVFLFSPVRRYLHVWHSIIPLLVMMYPLCCAAWVTKQYNWFIIVVVKAWVHRNDLDDDSDSSNAGDSGIDGMSTSQATSQGRFSKLFQGQFFKKKVNSDMSQSSVSIHQLPRSQSSELNKSNKKTLRRLSTGNIKDKLKNVTSLFPWQKEASVSNNNNTNTTKPSTGLGKLLDTVIAAKAVSKFKSVVKKPRFNFEKFLSYLESMRNVVGFNIAGVMITWDKVSTTLFLLFSIIAVFVQESIFGSKKSTL